MQYKVIDGKAIAQHIRNDLKAKVASMTIKPHLAILQVGDRPDSSQYVRMKEKACLETGISFTLKNLPQQVTQSDLLKQVQAINQDRSIHGLLVQLPLPAHLDEEAITNAVSSIKDVDGFHLSNIGNLVKKGSNPQFVACTPKGIMELLKRSNVQVEGKLAVVIGRSNIVGMPVFHLLTAANATVTLCHSKTPNLKAIVSQADIVVAAIGQPELVRGEWLKPGAVVIDVGTNQVEDSSKKSGYRWVGDVHYESALDKCQLITPVPGGVGPMTVAMLLQNVVEASQGSYSFEPVKLDLKLPVPSDIEIAYAHQPKLIQRVAEECGVMEDELDLYGKYKAKVRLSILDRYNNQPDGSYVVVTGITPTPLGEGKSTTTMGLCQALGAHLGKTAFACVRQPSQGPTFGVKGGAAGGGYAQAQPMEEFNLHLTGDLHAVTAANNLLAAAIDARMFHESTQSDKALFDRICPVKKGKRTFSDIMFKRLKKLNIQCNDPSELTPDQVKQFVRLDIDPSTISWNRVIDTNDRFLRKITVGQNSTEKGQSRETGFDITVASEIMAILALASDEQDMDLRFGKMVVAQDKQGTPVTADDVGCTGALTALMKDAIMPNLMQTLEGTPVLVHAGPFANLATGNSSVIADKIALKLAGQNGFVVTEAGFGADIGMEKFFNIKCRSSGLVPDCVVLVATIKALKMHGGGPDVVAGKALADVYTSENLDLVKEGCQNMQRHIRNASMYGVPVVVAINKFTSDSDNEINAVRQAALEAGAVDAVSANHWTEGGKGAVALAQAVVEASKSTPSPNPQFKFLYPLSDTIEQKITTIAKKMYHAAGIELSDLAQKKLQQYEQLGYGHFPICMAKTQYSFSHDSKQKNVPSNFILPIKDVRVSVGAGFVYPLVGEIQTMPGLPTRPSFYDIQVKNGRVQGLF